MGALATLGAVGALATLGVVGRAGAAGADGGARVGEVLAKRGHSNFENGTWGHDLHTKPPAAATPPAASSVPRTRHLTRRRLRPASGANSSDKSTFPSHMLSSGTLRRGLAAPDSCGGGGFTELPGEIDRI